MPNPPLAGSSILVVEGEGCGALDVRRALMELGATVHVVRTAAAGLMIAKRKRLHGAILDCVTHGASLPLCTELALSGVPFMFYGGLNQSAAVDAADTISELISIDHRRTLHAGELQAHGSGGDCHQAL